jgi:hypothetical protein
MDADLEARILELLRASPAMAMPLREVHRLLAAELGPGTGSLPEFRDRLRARPGTLFLVEPESPLGEAASWPAAARSEYEQALREAGLELEPWLTAMAAEAAAVSDPGLAHVGTSLLELWEAARDPALREAIASAFAELRQVRLQASAAGRCEDGER